MTLRSSSQVIDLNRFSAKHMSGELRCPVTALIVVGLKVLLKFSYHKCGL